MYRFRSIKYLSTSGFITALLFVVGYGSASLFGAIFSKLLGQQSTLQLFDCLFLPLCVIFAGPMMLFASVIAAVGIDFSTGIALVTIPATVLIRILMFFVVKAIGNKIWWLPFISFFVACLLLTALYPFYFFLVFHEQALVIKELIVDAIQSLVTYFLSCLILLCYYRFQQKMTYLIWDDKQFDYLKHSIDKK